MRSAATSDEGTTEAASGTVAQGGTAGAAVLDRVSPEAHDSHTSDLVDAWGSWGPTMTPDSRRVAFVSDRSGIPALWIADVDPTGPPAPARHVPLSDDPVVSVSWAADSRWLACAVATDGGVRTQVWVVRPDGTGARRVAGGSHEHVELGPWTRSGHRFVVTFPSPAPDRPTRSFLVEPATGRMDPLSEGGLLHVLDISLEERFLVLRDGERGQQFCVVVDRLADEDFALLPHGATGSTDVALIRPAPQGEPGPLYVYLASDVGLPRRQLIGLPMGPNGWRGEPSTLASRDDAELEGLDADDAGQLLLLVWNAAGRSELELLDTTTHAWSRISEAPTLPDLACVVPVLESFPGRDGLPLTGWLYQARAAQGAPRAAEISLHGGPEAQERPSFNPNHQAMAAAGITVFAPNIRGSSGFGREFVHADDVAGRFGAFEDVLAAADHLVRRGLAEAGRIAVTGRSYGGYLTLASLAFSPGVFAAGIDICGMSDLCTFYRDTEPWIAAAAVSKYGHPERDRALLEDISPLASAEHIRAPLLVVHGEHDTNVPIGEAHQIVAALREMGRPVDYLELRGEGHEYRRASSRRELVQRSVQFLVEHLVTAP